MAFTALNYLGSVTAPIRTRANEVCQALYNGKRVTLTHVWGLNPGAGGDHGAGRALDFMVFENEAAGHYIANYLMANHKRLGVRYIMWNHRIWNVELDKYGAWRWVPDRGSPTQNHMDHVHVSFYDAAKYSYTPPTTPVVTPTPAPAPALPKSWFLVEDGKNGPGTRKAIQRLLGVTADGVWGPGTRKAIQRWAGVRQDGNLGPTSRKAVQKKLGIRQTGIWNWDQSTRADATTKAFQAYYNRAVRNRRRPI